MKRCVNAFTTWDKASIKFLLLFKADFNLMVRLFIYGWGKHRANGIHRRLRFWNSCRPRLLQQSALLTSFTVFQVGSIVCLFLSLFIILGVIISCYLIWCTFSRFKTRDEWPPVIRLKIHMGKLIKHFFCLLMKEKNLVNTQLSSQLWKESFKRKSCFEVRLSSIRHSERTKPAEKNANTRKTLWRNF